MMYRSISYYLMVLGTFHIKDVTPTGDEEAAKVKVKVRMSIHGTFFVKSATMVERVKQVEVELPSVESMETDNQQTKTEQTADVDMEQVPSSDTPADGGKQGQSPPGGEEDAVDAPENPDGEQATPTKEEDTMDASENPGGEEQATPTKDGQDSNSSPDVEKKAVSSVQSEDNCWYPMTNGSNHCAEILFAWGGKIDLQGEWHHLGWSKGDAPQKG